MIRYVLSLFVILCSTSLAGESAGLELRVKGMHCEHCVDRVRSAVLKVRDVEDVKIDLKQGTARVKMVSGAVTASQVAQAIANVGYGVTYQEGDQTRSLEAKGDMLDEDCVEQMDSDCMKNTKGNCCGEQRTKGKMKKK